MYSVKSIIVAIVLSTLHASNSAAAERPNIIIVFADDISAREFPIYGSSVWTKDKNVDTSDEAYRAQTPVLDQMAKDGCWVKTAWASVVCSPSRAMMMTGRYAHLHKWWNNSYKGRYIDDKGRATTWPLYMSSPLQIGHVAQQAGYATYWAGKTQMAGDLRKYGFDQGCFTPGNLADTDNPFTDFKLVQKKVDDQKLIFNQDTGKSIDTYLQHGWYFYPHVRLMNHDNKDFQWWPNTSESNKTFGLGTYGPDVELDFIFDFMDRHHEKGKPFFVYHTTHLGHGAFDWLNPANGQCWPGTPVIQWDGEKYARTKPHITGDDGVYDTHGTVTDPGIKSHIEYLDYQMWLYRNRLQEMGIAENTVVIFCADNGTAGYGKNSHDRQKGVHVPLIIYAPGMTKHGEQDVLVNMSDLLPTIAELTGAAIPDDYAHNGESLVPFLYTDQPGHREWVYGYSRERQIIRGDLVMMDGYGKWWDVSEEPSDLISYSEITDWESVPEEHRAERDKLSAVLPKFDLFKTEPDAPGVGLAPKSSEPKTIGSDKSGTPTASAVGPQQWKVVFTDDYEDRTEIGKAYATSRGHEDSWSVVDGVLVGKQTKTDHGAVIRTELNFDDVDIQFDFRFSGGKSFNFVIDDAHEKSVHAGHICRVSVFPKYLKIGDDKTGSMNLKVREKRQDKNLSSTDTEALQNLLDRTQSSAKIGIKPGEWHTLRIRIRGDVMKAFLNGDLVTSLRSPGFDHPTKTKFGFTVNGEAIDFDNLSVRQLKQETRNISAGQKASVQSETDPVLTREVTNESASRPPNILWIITDDHRADSIRAFNQATAGRDDSELGFVSSPCADELARQGVLFTRAYCNSPGCAPSRTSMLFGMYPHHCGQYGFESGHQSADFCKPFFPQLLAEQGYRTAHFGKSGYASFDWGERKLIKTTPYEVSIDQKELYAHERVDWFHRKTWGKGGHTGDEAFWAMSDGGIYIRTPIEGPQSDEDTAKKERVKRELDLLYRLGDYNGLIIGGVSPQPTASTQDGNITAAFIDYLQHAGDSYETPWGRELEGAPTDIPVFLNLGFHFPHTPVLPSKEFRDQFTSRTYQVPEFSKEELKKLPPQLVSWFEKTNFADLPPEDQQQAIRDYFAFCAMGDSLAGKAIEQFKAFSEKQNREYVILYVIGDHGWHLGEQGGESKFAPYDTSNHCAVIAVSSDGKHYPAGTVCDEPIEFVDFAPTILKAAGADLSADRYVHLDGHPLDATLNGEFHRDYVIGEMNHHIGPRAYLRADNFAFSMRTREKSGKFGTKWGHAPGENVKWALEAPREHVELALFDLRVDPNEQNNVANDIDYVGLADWFRRKLGRIVLGDERVESDWTKENSYSVSNFAVGAHDAKLDIPASIIPQVHSKPSASAPDLRISLGPVSKQSIFGSETWSHWGGSVVKGNDGRYHMLYSRWPKKLGWAWVTDSEIAHATAPTPFGPFEHQGDCATRVVAKSTGTVGALTIRPSTSLTASTISITWATRATERSSVTRASNS